MSKATFLEQTSGMKVLVCYICVARGQFSQPLASRFVTTYSRFRPGLLHQLVVICNGGKLNRLLESTFAPIHPILYPRPNVGADIGAYLELAPKTDAEMMVCLGESTYFHRSGWLERLAKAYETYGPGMYGSLSSYLVRPHLNTTGFAVGPEFLRGWPTMIRTRQERYEFEHGEGSLWRRLSLMGKPTKLITWDGEYDPDQWRDPPNILWRGNQSNVLMWCKHTDRYYHASQEIKERWAAGADYTPELKTV